MAGKAACEARRDAMGILFHICVKNLAFYADVRHNAIRMKERWPLYPQAERTLGKVGNDLRDARRRRRISTTTLAERARISRATLYRIEKGDRGVSIGSYVSVIFALGLLDHLNDAFDASHDAVGLGLEAEQMPKNIVNKRYER